MSIDVLRFLKSSDLFNSVVCLSQCEISCTLAPRCSIWIAWPLRTAQVTWYDLKHFFTLHWLFFNYFNFKKIFWNIFEIFKKVPECTQCRPGKCDTSTRAASREWRSHSDSTSSPGRPLSPRGSTTHTGCGPTRHWSPVSSSRRIDRIGSILVLNFPKN